MLLRVIRYSVAGLIAIFALVLLTQSVLSAAFMVLAFLLVLPESARRIGRRLPSSMTRLHKALVACALVVAAFATTDVPLEPGPNAQDRFAAERDSLLAHFSALEAAGDDRALLTALEPYRRFEDADVEGMAHAAQERFNQARVGELRRQAAALPDTNVVANRDAYAELVRLAPDSTRFADRLAHYQDRVTTDSLTEVAWNLIVGPQPVQSAWDGAYPEVKRFLQATLNDPKSLEMDGCTPVSRHDDGWLVGCDYRARNAFGGVVRQSHWFLVQRGAVVQVFPASAYRSR
jgi:hypothetical protein